MTTSDEADRIQEFLNITFDTISEGITIYDEDLRLVAWNKTYEAMEVTPDQFLSYGASLLETYEFIARQGVFGEGDPKVLARRHVDALRQGPLIETEILTPPTGRIIRIRRSRLPNGGMSATFTDITEETHLQDQLRQAQKLEAIGRLTAGIAHDFNNLLAVVMGNLELFRDQVDDAVSLEMIDAALTAVDRGSSLTQKLLSFGRRAALRPETLDANGIIRDMEDLLRRTLTEQIDLQIDLGEGLWPVSIDRSQFENAILNLVINARDAMESSGVLKIRTRNVAVDLTTPQVGDEIAPGRYVEIAITDTGAGMPAEVIKQAFEPFFTTKSIDKGSGLGLAMVYGFARQSGGVAKIESEMGRGTIVRVFFPAKDDTTWSSDIDPPADTRSMTSVAGKRILLVDDSEDVRATIRDQLTSLGCEVVLAHDGASALAKLSAQLNVDILLVDVLMPGDLQGPDVAKRALKIRPELKVIYISGYAKRIAEHSDHPFSDDTLFLEKPISRAALARAMRQALK